ncbi:MAG: Uma2 family endonuclease [Spirochaetota bacterium]
MDRSLLAEAEPDLAVVKGNVSTYKDKNPITALLVIEIARTSAIFDRLKASVYASANIPEYWIVHTGKKQIEAYSQPVAGKYKEKQVLQKEDTLTLFGKSISTRMIWGD